MGPAHSTVVNQSMKPLCIITFNMADLIYKTYHTLYIVEPGETCKVEANPDAIGLKLGVIYDSKKDKQELLFHRFTCNNDSILTIISVEGEDIQFYGDGTTLNTRGKLREMNVEPFNMAADTLRMETAVAPPPSKAQEFLTKVVDSSEVMLHKVKATMEHPAEFIRTGHLAELPPTLPSTASNSSSSTNNYSQSDNYNGNNYNANANGNYNNNNNNNNINNINNGNNYSDGQHGIGGNNYNDYGDNSDNLQNDYGNNINSNGKARSASPQPQNSRQAQSKSENVSKSASKKGQGQQRDNNSRGKSSGPQQSPSQRTGKNGKALPDVQSEEEKQATAERWEAELQRVKREKLWEAEVARIKADRIQQEEDEQRRLAEEAQALENARQGKLTPMPKHKKRGGEDHGEEGPEVVGGGGCHACIVS